REDQDLIFRYRANRPSLTRQMIRADRVLAIRLADYARVPAVVLAHTDDDVERALIPGRARYLVTCSPDGGTDRRTDEMRLAHDAASSRTGTFRLLGTYPLLVQYDGAGSRDRLFLWEYMGDLPEGPSEIPLTIPTAGLQFDVPP